MLHYPKTRGDWLALRTTVITSTEMPALFGESPYNTEFGLWHAKRDAVIDDFEPNERMVWGTRLQDAIARGVGDDYGVKVRKLTAFATHESCRMGASFDFEIVGLSDTCRDSVLRELYEKHGPGVLEVKNVDGLVYKKDWPEGEAPAHIEIQAQAQIESIDRNWSAICALVGGNRIELLIRMRDREVGAAMRAAVDRFWKSIADNKPPAPDFLLDADLIRKAYGLAEPGKLFDGRGNERVRELCRQYAEATAQQKTLKDTKDACAAELLTIIGSAEKALVDGYSISASMRAGYHVDAYDVDARRDFRITAKKEKSK